MSSTLVILPNWLGDVVMGAALLSQLHARDSEAPLHVAVPSHLAALAELLPGVTHVHGYRRGAFGGPFGAFRLGRKLRESGPFDICYCLPRSFRSAITAFASGAVERVGYRQELRALLLTRPYRRQPGVHRAVEFAFLASGSLDPARQAATVGIARPAGSAFGALGISPERPAVALHIHSAAQSRRMSIEKWARVAARIGTGIAGSLVLVGSKQDAERTREFSALLPPEVRVYDLAGRTSSGELAGVLAACDAVLASDSGPAHLANAMGVPVVVLLGAGDERCTAPFNTGGLRLLRTPGLSCAPCVENTCRLGVPRCLEDLDEDAIVEAVEALIRRPG